MCVYNLLIGLFKVRRQRKFDSELEVDPTRRKRSRWGARRARTTDVGELESLGGLPRRQRFSYEIPDSDDPPLKPRSSLFSFRSNSAAADPYNAIEEQAFDFGTAFEFAPGTIEDPALMEAREKKAKRKGIQEEDVIPKAYTSIFTYESAFFNGKQG